MYLCRVIYNNYLNLILALLNAAKFSLFDELCQFLWLLKRITSKLKIKYNKERQCANEFYQNFNEMHIVPQRIYGFSKLNNFFHVERHFAFMFYSIHHISWTKLCVVQTKGKQTHVLPRRRLPPVVRSVQTYIGGKLNEPLQMKYTIGIKCYDKAINVPHHLCIILEKGST